MNYFSIDKQRDQVNVEWMSRPVDSFKKQIKNQPLVLVLTSMEQSPTFAYRLKRKLLSGLIIGGAYTGRLYSKTHRCFYFKYDPAVLSQLKRRLEEVSIIESSAWDVIMETSFRHTYLKALIVLPQAYDELLVKMRYSASTRENYVSQFWSF